MRNVIGTWALERVRATAADGRELATPYGGKPMGRVHLGADGRMMAVTVDARATLPAGEVREYSSYCGNYTFDGKTLVTRVDAASDPARIGSDQVREVRFDGELMVLAPPLRAYGSGRGAERRELWWRKISDV